MAKEYLDINGLTYFWGKLKAAFQEKLVSGTNIKTVNNNSLLGAGNISISGGGSVSMNHLSDEKSFTNTSQRVSLSSGTTDKTVLSVTAPCTGYVFVTGYVAMTTNSSGNRHVTIKVGSTVVYNDTRAANGTNNGNLGAAAAVPCTQGDTIAIQSWQSSGSTLYAGGRIDAVFIAA